MSLSFVERTLKSLQRHYGVNDIRLTKYTVGTIDFTVASSTSGVQSITVRGIAMPKSLNVAFLQKFQTPTDKKSRDFLINDPTCTQEWVKEGNFLTYLGERYNIKMSETLENYYFFVSATSTGDEATSQNELHNHGLVFTHSADAVIE